MSSWKTLCRVSFFRQSGMWTIASNWTQYNAHCTEIELLLWSVSSLASNLAEEFYQLHRFYCHLIFSRANCNDCCHPTWTLLSWKMQSNTNFTQIKIESLELFATTFYCWIACFISLIFHFNRTIYIQFSIEFSSLFSFHFVSWFLCKFQKHFSASTLSHCLTSWWFSCIFYQFVWRENFPNHRYSFGMFISSN